MSRSVGWSVGPLVGSSVHWSVGPSVADCSEHATHGDRPCFFLVPFHVAYGSLSAKSFGLSPLFSMFFPPFFEFCLSLLSFPSCFCFSFLLCFSLISFPLFVSRSIYLVITPALLEWISDRNRHRFRLLFGVGIFQVFLRFGGPIFDDSYLSFPPSLSFLSSFPFLLNP